MDCGVAGRKEDDAESTSRSKEGETTCGNFSLSFKTLRTPRRGIRPAQVRPRPAQRRRPARHDPGHPQARVGGKSICDCPGVVTRCAGTVKPAVLRCRGSHGDSGKAKRRIREHRTMPPSTHSAAEAWLHGIGGTWFGIDPKQDLAIGGMIQMGGAGARRARPQASGSSTLRRHREPNAA